MSVHGCFPSHSQELLLRACFAAEEKLEEEFRAWLASVDVDAIDQTSLRLLPLLDQRWKGAPPDERVAFLSSRARLAIWKQNQEQIRTAIQIREDLARALVPCMFLKGVALVLRRPGNSGLRAMGDVDVLVSHGDAAKGIEALRRAEWVPESGYAVGREAQIFRTRHAWQFSKNGAESDLHWRPIARGYNPELARLFWEHAEVVSWSGAEVTVPAPTELLFHVCVHGLQWDWSPKVRWVSDALQLTQREDEIDWSRLWRLATVAQMTHRLRTALQYLSERFGVRIPSGVPAHRAPRWEKREQELLAKPCPLSLMDSVSWHWTNFRRLHPFDMEWSRWNRHAAFWMYMRTFLEADGRTQPIQALRSEVRKRMARPLAVPASFRMKLPRRKSTVCLVIVFNHPYPQNIGKLRKIYRERFSDIVFLMPNARTDDPDCFTGYRGSYCYHGLIADARDFLINRAADAYLFAADDALLNPQITERKAISALRLDKHDAFVPEIRFLAGERIVDGQAMASGAATDWIWTERVLTRLDSRDSLFGAGAEGYLQQLPTRQAAFDKFRQYGNVSTQIRLPRPRVTGLAPEYDLPFPMAYGLCDVFSIRSQSFDRFAHYVGILAALDIFVEVAIPTALILATDRIATAADAGWTYSWGRGMDTSRVTGIGELEQMFPPHELFVHPVKLSGMPV